MVAVVVRSDGNEHRHVAALGHLGPTRQEVVHAAADSREQQIVQGHAEVVLRPAQAIERLAQDHRSAVEADAGIERAGGRGHGLGEQAGERRGVVRHDVAGPGRMPQGAPPVRQDPPRLPAETFQPDLGHGQPGRSGDRLPAVGGVWGRRMGFEVEQDRRQFDAREAVGHGVVKHLEKRDATALEPVDQPHVPQWSAAIEREGHPPGAEGQELGIVTWLR